MKESGMSDERPSAGGTASDKGRRGARSPRGPRPLWQSIVVNVLAMLVLVSLIQAFVVRVHNVSSGSMEQTLSVTDRVLSSHLPYLASPPARGDIVIFAHGDTWDTAVRTPDPNPLKQAVRYFGDVTSIGISNHFYTVKRVIGVAGDTVSCCDAAGHVVVNGTPTSEPYLYQDLPFTAGVMDCVTDTRSTRCFAPIVVPAGKLLVMGDHRSNSADSVIACRMPGAASDCAKFVDVGQVSGKVIARAWPPGPIG
jgi:signal peptidase I